MKTLTLDAEVTNDGMLHLAVPSGLPPGKVEVVIVVQPKPPNGASLLQAHTLAYGDALEQETNNGAISSHHQVAATDPASLSERERLTRLMELLDMALEGVTWEEIEEGRRDRDLGD